MKAILNEIMMNEMQWYFLLPIFKSKASVVVPVVCLSYSMLSGFWFQISTRYRKISLNVLSKQYFARVCA